MLGWGDLFEEGDRIYVDQAPQWGFGVSVVYTPTGVRNLDTGFCAAIRVADTMEECRHIARVLVECPNLHLTIKENLMLNLVNVMTGILSGKRVCEHVCTRSCIEKGTSVLRSMACPKKAFNFIAEHWDEIKVCREDS
jgi:Pyruvate/2-oxoacid:ferredoxin oxidoreductase delta subunit